MQPTINAASPAVPTGIVNTPTILVTGATGNIGSELVKLLSKQAVPFRVVVRSANDAQVLASLPGVEVVLGDFDNPATMGLALRGIDRAFLLTPSSEQAEAQQLNFVKEAKKAGVQHIVKLSQLAAKADSPVRFLRYHAIVEQALRESGMDFTFLRPNLFMQGLLGFRDSIVEQGKFFAAIGQAKISAVDVRDIAAVAAAALTGPGHAGMTYTLTGPQALTHSEMADELATALDYAITFIDITPEAMRGALTGFGFPAWQADGLIEDYAHYSRGEASAITSDVSNVLGMPARSFTDFARAYAPAFARAYAL